MADGLSPALFKIVENPGAAQDNLRRLRESFKGSLAAMGAEAAGWADRSQRHVAVLTAALESLTRNAQRGYGPLGETLRQFNGRLRETANYAATAAPAFTALELRMMQIRRATEMSGVSLMRFSAAMGAGVGQAIVYGNSIGAAMEKALKATLASIAARALVHAIYETAVGFAELFWNPPAAAAAFEAAALFYAVAGAAGALGAAVPGGGRGARGQGAAAPGGASAAGRNTAARRAGSTRAEGFHRRSRPARWGRRWSSTCTLTAARRRRRWCLRFPKRCAAAA